MSEGVLLVVKIVRPTQVALEVGVYLRHCRVEEGGWRRHRALVGLTWLDLGEQPVYGRGG